MSGSDQIALPLDWPQSAVDRRFIVSDANRDAFEIFRQWTLWPVKAAVLVGPRRSGRTLLARQFIDRVGGRLFDGAERHPEEDLFHAWNQAQETGRPLIMVVDDGTEWSIRLPDLRTRIAVTAIARINQPDDALFEALIGLRFADRGLILPPDAISFITSRTHRDYWTIERVVESVDRFAIAGRARMTLPTVRRALAEAGIIDTRGVA